MSTGDDDLPDTDLPDTAMASGSDAGSAGEHLGPDDLEPDEQRLLDQLQRDLDGRPSATSPSSVAEVRAAEDEGPLPAHGGSQQDGLDAVFDPPREG
jgi:hypothetical protein